MAVLLVEISVQELNKLYQIRIWLIYINFKKVYSFLEVLGIKGSTFILQTMLKKD
ncbi:MAG: hypothetical protein O2U61_02005 [Candidatus Bathyarchaeota archaeon]|nr:hypothetical protein [Candidatus Bathyarchaeota archaeon]